MKKQLLSLMMLPLALSLSACPSPKNSDKPQIVTVYMGDPDSLTAGTETEPLLDGDFVLKNKDFRMHSMMVIESSAKYQKGGKLNFKKKRSGSSINGGSFPEKIMKSEEMKFSAEIDTASGKLILKNTDNSFILEFTRENNSKWRLTDLRSETQRLSQTTLISPSHFSISEDKNFFNILFRAEDLKNSKDKSMMILYFQINPTFTSAPMSWANSKFKFVDDHARWNPKKTLNLELCSQESAAVQSEIASATRAWSEVLKGKLDFQLTTPKKRLPFSDLNTRCIMTVDGFLGVAHPSYQNYGVTFNIANQEKSEFIDGDIFIFKREFIKDDNAFESSAQADTRVFTFLHEIGHLLGLDHQFDGTKSIMSYDFEMDKNLQVYDEAAIQYLYN